VYGGGVLRGAPTPRIDKLASEGMRLLNFNVEAQCTPSRAAIMTGRYAVRTGNGSIPIETPIYGLTQWEVTMAEMLSDAGYRTDFGWQARESPLANKRLLLTWKDISVRAARLSSGGPCSRIARR